VHGQSSTTRGRLQALGARPRKRLSQAFLDDPRVAAAIVRAARLDPSRDEVLEVGPGLGVLTERLVKSARRVVAVEIDPQLADWLRTELASPRLRVETADILTLDLASLFDDPYVVVANLPYHITSPALRRLLESGPPFASRLVVMVQREVAERITAPVGQLSALAVTIQAQAEVRLVQHVPAAAFYPRPKVDSAVLALQPYHTAQRPVSHAALPTFVAFVHAGFKQPRKQMVNSLAEGLGIDKPRALELLAQTEIAPTRRPQTLSVTEWVRLFEQLE
jgi:16S rRNA (adenine1518-N6/adenine1519-N6)-dimethyltransferase